MDESYYKLTLLIGLILLATVLGIFALYSHTIMPGLGKTNDSTFVNAFQAIDRRITNPIFMLQFFGPLLLLGVAAYYASKHQLVEAKYIYLALACYLLAVILTMAVNVPLNDGIKKVADISSQQSLAAAREQFQESKWVIFNHIRTFLTLAATGLTAAAVWVSKLV